MPVADDPRRPDGRVLLDGAGVELARFQEVRRENRRVADLLALSDGVDPRYAAGVVTAKLVGWRVAAEEPFGRLLVAAGGRPRRHGHAMSRDLARDPAPPGWLAPSLPAGVRLTAVDRPAIDLAPASLAAYPREHPDFDHIATPDHPEVELEEIISGRMVGPLLRCSGLAVGEGGDVLGAVLINETESHRSAGRGSSSSSAIPAHAGSAPRCCAARSRSPRATGCPRSGRRSRMAIRRSVCTRRTASPRC
jgi:hypothetical protein